MRFDWSECEILRRDFLPKNGGLKRHFCLDYLNIEVKSILLTLKDASLVGAFNKTRI